MEHAEVSAHQVKVFLCVQRARKWMSNADIARETGVAPRTVREHTKRLVALGIFDQEELFPRHAYRYSEQASNRNKAYALRLEKAATIFAEMLSCQ
jgi:predicted ArsR family transcriptional regulator